VTAPAAVTPLTYDCDQAAARLGSTFTPDWLKRHARELPHIKSGKGRGRAGRIGFTEAHLAEILVMFERRPAAAPAPSSPDDFSSVVSRGGGRRAS
jgi:hypothetical protein